MSALTWSECLTALSDLCLDSRGDPSLLLSGASSDSRRLHARSVFCAIPGEHEDGAAYVPAALEAGACAVIAAHSLPELPEHIAFALVSDAYASAARIAEIVSGCPARRLRLYGVTGTNGKTTVAFLLRDMFRAEGRETGMIGTVQYEFAGKVFPADRTTPMPFDLQPLLAQMVEAGVDSVVAEVSSHALAQRRMGVAKFAGAIFTNLTGDHLDYHKDLESYYEVKSRLFLESLSGAGHAVVNVDDPWGAILAEEIRSQGGSVASLGQSDTCDVRITDVELEFDGVAFTLGLPGGKHRFHSPLIGLHNVYNASQAAALAVCAGVSPEVVSGAVSRSCGAPGRLQAVSSPRGFTAYVDYAHTDDALRNVLAALRHLQPGRILTVFGCGGDRDRSKRPRMGRVAAELSDRVYVTSDNPRTEDPESIIDEVLSGVPRGTSCVRLSDRAEAIESAIREARSGDLVLIAGKGHETYQEVDGMQHPFDDVDVVRTAIEQNG